MWTWKSVPERPCGYGDAHTDNALCRGIEVKQDCGYSPLSKSICAITRSASLFVGLPIVKVGINFDSERHTLGIGLSNKEPKRNFFTKLS